MRVVSVFFFVCVSATSALAQQRPPVPPVVADVRGFYAALGQDARTAADLGVSPEQLPNRGLGLVGGVHGYPYRRPGFAVGIGGELLIARGRATEKDANDEPTGFVIEQRLFSLSPAVSINFGHRDGWSYLSGGMGPLSFETFTGTIAPADAPPTKMTINMGGGARWFVQSHLAVCFDVRFYLTRPEDTTESHPGRDRNRLLVLSGGFAFK